MFACSASMFAHAVVFYYHVFLNTNKHLLTLKPGQLYAYRNRSTVSKLRFYHFIAWIIFLVDGLLEFLRHEFKQLEDWMCRMCATAQPHKLIPCHHSSTNSLQRVDYGLDDPVFGVSIPSRDTHCCTVCFCGPPMSSRVSLFGSKAAGALSW